MFCFQLCLKHYKKGWSDLCGFVPKNWNTKKYLEFLVLFFCPKMSVSWPSIGLSKFGFGGVVETPYFIVFGGCVFWGQVVRKGFLEKSPKHRAFSLIIEKCFCMFWCFSFWLCFVFGLFCFYLPYFVWFVFLFLCFLQEKTVVAPKGFCVYFWVSPFLSP